MSGIEKVTDLADAHGWMELSRSAHGVTFFKWAPNITRIEVHVITDAAGRIEAVSIWHNRRQHIADQPGVRAETERILTEGTAP